MIEQAVQQHKMSSKSSRPFWDDARLCKDTNLVGGQAPLHAQHHLGKLGNAVLHDSHVQKVEGGPGPGLGSFSPLTAACPHQQP